MNAYQKSIYDYYISHIINCKSYSLSECSQHLPDLSGSKYSYGPEMAYVGSKYGNKSAVRILFTRKKPAWDKEFGWFGPKESIRFYEQLDSKKTIFDQQLIGINRNGREFRGIQDAGTVSGYRNENVLSESEKENRIASPRYGVLLILRKLTEIGALPDSKGNLLDYCAINNILKCSTTSDKNKLIKTIKKNCMFDNQHYIQEIKRLKPQIIIVMGNVAQSWINQIIKRAIDPTLNNYFSINNSYWKFPSAASDSRGIRSWKGKDIEERKDIRDLTSKEDLDSFKAGPEGTSTYKLLSLIHNLADQIKSIQS